MCDSECSDADTTFERESLSEDTLKAHIDYLKQKRSVNAELSSTVNLIECENGTKVYLCGTSHFSDESINDVRYVITLIYDYLIS